MIMIIYPCLDYLLLIENDRKQRKLTPFGKMKKGRKEGKEEEEEEEEEKKRKIEEEKKSEMNRFMEWCRAGHIQRKMEIQKKMQE